MVCCPLIKSEIDACHCFSSLSTAHCFKSLLRYAMRENNAEINLLNEYHYYLFE